MISRQDAGLVFDQPKHRATLERRSGDALGSVGRIVIVRGQLFRRPDVADIGALPERRVILRDLVDQHRRLPVRCVPGNHSSDLHGNPAALEGFQTIKGRIR